MFYFYIVVFAAYVVISKAMGHTGEVMYFLLLIAATTTSMCAEIIGVSSIIVYDIYKTYIRVYVYSQFNSFAAMMMAYFAWIRVKFTCIYIYF